jgi:ubiquinone/menaquinone biosynthesis C-methylase UbiE
MTTPPLSQPTSGEAALFSGSSFPEMYERALVGPLFDPWVQPLLDDVELGAADRVLDVACGTGIVARRARERLGEAGTVVGIDANPEMIAVGRRVAPAIDLRQGDAAALPLREGESFDVVLCQQGFQFFPDRAAAAREMRRALVDDGRLGLSTWRPDEEFPVLRELRALAERHVGPITDRRYSLGDSSAVEAVLEEAGFRQLRSKRYTRIVRFRDGSVFVRLNAMALVSMSASRALADDERNRLVDQITRDSVELVRQHTDERGFAYEIGTNVVLATA